MKNEKSSYGLILSSIVGVVALVGLVMLFGSHVTGATVNEGWKCNGLLQNAWMDKDGRFFTTGTVCTPMQSGENWGYIDTTQGSVEWGDDVRAVKWKAPEEWSKREVSGPLQPSAFTNTEVKERSRNTGSLS